MTQHRNDTLVTTRPGSGTQSGQSTEDKLTLAYLKRLEASRLPSTNMRTTEEDRALPVLWVMTTWYHLFGWNWKGRATSVSFGAMQRTTTLLPAHTPAGFGNA